jgi:predicted porin
MQLLQKLTRKTVSRDRLVPILSILVFAAYPGESWAADNATGQTSAEPGVSVIGISQKAPAGELPARLKAPETSPPSSGPPSSTAVPQASANQTASRAHSVAAKPVEVVPNPSAIPMSEPSPIPSSPPPLTWLGVTLYGVVDVGLAHLSHGAPASNTYGPGLPYIVQSFSRDSMTSIANNGLSQSKIGLSGVEPLGAADLKGVFKIETGFQPTTGRLTDGPRSLVDNNGRTNVDKVTGGDSSRAGQPFQGAAFAGISSAMVGTLTFGRQNSLMADDLMKYDPQLQSQAFSPIGYSGAAGGLGDTEDKTLDDSLKYTVGYGPLHVAGLYQFSSRGSLPGGSESLDVGLDDAGFSIDFLWGRVRDAISAASLTAAQNATAPGTLAATVSDNTAYAVLVRYVIRSVKIYAGYEHMTFANPKDPLANGTITIGGYVLSTINPPAFTIHKVLQYAWIGARYSVIPSLDLTAAYYQFRQNSYNANGCSDSSSLSCLGHYHDASFVADYKLSLRFDLYAGVNYSRATDGMAAGFLSDHNWTSMLGLRFMF